MAGGGSLHKKDWLKIGALTAATVATAGAAAPAMAGLLGGEAAAAGAAGAGAAGAGAAAIPEAGSALYGASGATDLAGASGAAAAGTPSVAAPGLGATMRMGVQNAGFNLGMPTGWDKTAGSLLKGANTASKTMGLLQPAPMKPGSMPSQGMAPQNTYINPQAGGVPGVGQGGMNDDLWKRFLAQQGGQ